MQATPGWPQLSSCLFYDDPKAGIDWLCKAFGFEVRLLVESGDGKLVHSELVYGDGVLMVGGTDAQPFAKSPRAAGGNTQSLSVYINGDIEQHYARAKEHGAQIFRELAVSDYGDEFWSDRSYGAVDPSGHHFWFSQRLKTGDASYAKVRNKHSKHG